MCKLKNLYNLLISWMLHHSISCIDITGIALDSRAIVPGNLFIAVKGRKTDGRLYVSDAIRNGAIAILSESLYYPKITNNNKYDFIYSSVPIMYIARLDKYVNAIAGRFYHDPSRSLDLISVTGTNGKTTITCLLADWIQLLGQKSAVMGTLGNGALDNMSPSCNTTCSAIDSQKLLNQFVQCGVKFVAMEVSSHGLDQYRVDALYFKVAIFTNVSHDHLDYHGTFSKYVMAKWRLFNELCVENYVINADDDIGYQWLSYLSQAVAVTLRHKLPFPWKGRWICVININYHFYGTDIVFNSSWGQGVIHSVLLGAFNVINLLLALGALLVLGYSLLSLLAVSSQLHSICGRMEVFRSGGHPTAVIDYAHTPDALERVLIAIKQYCNGKLWCIFGCGGDRDQKKRALMGAIVERYADYVVVTNDNPRTEDPQDIIDDIMHGITYVKTIKIIQDRYDAISSVMQCASSEDIVLISGKGHEDYQVIGENSIYYSDRDVVKNIFKDYRRLYDSV